MPAIEQWVPSTFNYLRATTIYGGSSEIQKNVNADTCPRAMQATATGLGGDVLVGDFFTQHRALGRDFSIGELLLLQR